jgi:soluble lytic murein transglycosylase-like protein
MLRIPAFFLCAVAAAASGNDSQPASSVAKMQAAAEKQRAAVRRQISGVDPGSFFTTPWLDQPTAQMAPAAWVQADCDPLPAEQLQKLIAGTATAEAVNPLLLHAMVARESGGRPCAVSAKGAQGLMQIMPPTQADLGLTDPFDPAANISAGARYVKQLLARYKGNLRLALAAYNAGPQRVDDGHDVPAIPETQAYVSAILSSLKSSDQPVD